MLYGAKVDRHGEQESEKRESGLDQDDCAPLVGGASQARKPRRDVPFLRHAQPRISVRDHQRAIKDERHSICAPDWYLACPCEVSREDTSNSDSLRRCRRSARPEDTGSRSSSLCQISCAFGTSIRPLSFDAFAPVAPGRFDR